MSAEDEALLSCDITSAKRLRYAFSGLQNDNFCITSPKDVKHNCIAYAAGKRDRWWWPHPDSYWPIEAREETLDCFIQAYAAEGYAVCADGAVEPGFEKIAIYVDADDNPTHAAVQLPTGTWKSKCGSLEDIEHNSPEVVGGHRESEYGSVGQFMKRQI